MELIKYNRPKLPRNKYGINAKTGVFRGSVVTSEGSLNINYNYGTKPVENTETQKTETNGNLEWYNIQNKIVHSYEKTGKSVPQVDSYGDTMYDKNGDIKYKKEVKYIGSTWVTTIENYDYKLKDHDNYRMVLMRYRKRPREGRKWRIPWFTPKYWVDGDATQRLKMDIYEVDTWWNIQGRETKWWNNSQLEYTDENGKTAYRNKDYKDILPVTTEHVRKKCRHGYKAMYLKDANGNNVLVDTRALVEIPAFKNTHSNKMLVGCAIFKKTNTGPHGWQRISNIAVIEIRLSQKGNLSAVPKEYSI